MNAHLRIRRSPARSKSSQLIGVATVFALLAALLYAAVLAGPAGAQRRAGLSRRALAARLLKLDPGGRIGGETIVGVSNGDLLLGVADRVNFIVALGSGETIVGGNRSDQLGALGKTATIEGGPGADQIHGGPGHNTIYSGPGDDLITDTRGSATIYPGAGKNEVDVAGHPGRDRVLCASGSVDRIYANRRDHIAPSCRKAPGSHIVYHKPPPTPPSATKNGCTNNPNVDCAFRGAEGVLRGFWHSAGTPNVHCPPSHPYLLNKALYGTFFTRGVEARPLTNVGFYLPAHLRLDGYAVGVDSGSVTLWVSTPLDWYFNLHCSSDKTHGWRR